MEALRYLNRSLFWLEKKVGKNKNKNKVKS